MDGSTLGASTPLANVVTNLFTGPGLVCSTSGCTTSLAFTIGGGFMLPGITKTGGFTITATSHTVYANASSAALTINLPSCVAGNANQEYEVIKIDTTANAVTIGRATTTDTINGVASGKTLSSPGSFIVARCTDTAGAYAALMGGQGTASNYNVGTSGATLPLLSAANSFSAPQTFTTILDTPALGLSAAGTTLATATALTADVNEVTTVASGSGVSVRAWTSGVQRQEIINAGANTLNVYPGTASAAIRNLNGSASAGSAGAAVTLAVGTHMTMECVSTTLCYEAP